MADFENNKQDNKKNSPANEIQGQQGEKSGVQNAKTENNPTAKTADAGQDEIKAVKDIFNQAKDSAGKAYNAATDKATSKIDEQKSNIAQSLSGVADTIRQFGDSLGDTKQPNGVADIAVSYTNTAADKVEQISDYLENKDLGEVLGDVEDFAHRNPLLFISGAFALGILAGRFLKSSSSNRSLISRPHSGRKNLSLLKKTNDTGSTEAVKSQTTQAAANTKSSGGDAQSASAGK